MFIKQISIFVENKPGRLSAVTNILKENNIDIKALSIANTRYFGIFRLIVDDSQKACEALKNADFTCTVTLTDVMAVAVDDTPGGLAKIMELLYAGQISIAYMYAFISKTDKEAFVILRVEDNDTAEKIFAENNVKCLTQSDIRVIDKRKLH